MISMILASAFIFLFILSLPGNLCNYDTAPDFDDWYYEPSPYVAESLSPSYNSLGHFRPTYNLHSMQMTYSSSAVTELLGLSRILKTTDYDGVCPSGATRQTDTDCAVNNFSRAPLRKIADSTDFSAIKYIDFTDAGSAATGTIAEPYNSWNDWVWSDSIVYHFKRGVVYETTSERVISVHDILLGAYGTGVKPIIRSTYVGHAISLDGTGNVFTIRDLQFEAPTAYDDIISSDVRKSVAGLNIGKTSGNSALSCDVYNCTFYYTPLGLRVGYPVNDLRVINCDISKTATEGIYPLGDYIEVAFTDIYDINNWADTHPWIHSIVDGDNLGSGGDCFQSTYWKQIFIHNSILDHGDQPNKGTIMLESSQTGWEHERCIIEYNTLVGPEQGSTAVQTVNHASSDVGITLIGNILFESPLNNNASIAVWNGNTGVDTMMNNVFAGYATAIYQGYNDNTIIDNNAFYDITNAVSAGSARTITSFRNNITYGATNVLTNISATYNSNNYNSNPNFINPTINPYLYDFRLQPGSSAVDYGINTSYNLRDILYITRPQGINIDAGPYESTNSQ